MENFENRQQEEIVEQEPVKEKGANVSIDIKFIRHGERTKEGELTGYGRDLIKKKAEESGLRKENFDAIKAYGSQAGPKINKKAFPKAKEGMGRALETAYIYTEEIYTGDKKHTTRAKNLLSYETLKTEEPFNWKEAYNSNLPENYNQLSDKEKIEAAKIAQFAAANRLLSVDTPKAEQFKKETAGAFAKIVNHRIKMSERLDSGSKVLLVEGTHGPMPELLLKEALVRKTKDGQEIRGFKSFDEIGGPLYPAESIDVIVERDEKGGLKKVRVQLDPIKSQSNEELYLDPEKLNELEKFYDELHKEEK